jgi:hypothetical protein
VRAGIAIRSLPQAMLPRRGLVVKTPISPVADDGVVEAGSPPIKLPPGPIYHSAFHRSRCWRKHRRAPAFFEDEQYRAVAQHLPEDLRIAVATAKTCGRRIRFEVFPPGRRQLDLKAGAFRLDPGRQCTHLKEPHKGDPRRSLPVTLALARGLAGIPGWIPHDFHRTAGRNLERRASLAPSR